MKGHLGDKELFYNGSKLLFLKIAYSNTNCIGYRCHEIIKQNLVLLSVKNTNIQITQPANCQIY